MTPADVHAAAMTACRNAAGRAEVASSSLHRKHDRELLIKDRTPAEIRQFGERMRTNIRAAQFRRQHLRRRLLVLDSGGAPFVPERLLIAA